MDRFLSIYLNDQLAMGIAWRELARRAQKANRATELGDTLSRVAAEIAEDVETFGDIMRRLRIRRNLAKGALTTLAERIGRLKPNGRVATYSPLSRFEELEVLIMGIEGKKQLWNTLDQLADLKTRLPDIDFRRLIDRASRQRALLEPHRAQAGVDAFQY
ncbi:hypothetical protein [Amycolatopsis anabasis]|uniref:hypothetical protein n=1 Tax=Amycolatopsis anabasis TaxID=1840409 RepID=UPI00131B30C6|nr:hypothetical protein [Amycolatopsis anabasis]